MAVYSMCCQTPSPAGVNKDPVKQNLQRTDRVSECSARKGIIQRKLRCNAEEIKPEKGIM
ncbi:hypothetical protein XSR1_130023 [Xenorhabdus szentirmaii DSM 16338]|uniref:Uncharacterized protein n=1 Tax=Xenorhabdus szentirmaii DSM 16338 TaxID=1427518 RepID=W1IUD1_9GAMM|nr:hypothetical protein XSR1_130023 [Xenorhabdus szentirmaii DSM 16338]